MIVEAFVLVAGEPPFKGENEKEDLDDVEGRDEDVFVGGADEAQGFGGEDGHVFVDCVVGYVFVGGVVEGDEDVEEDCEESGVCQFFWGRVCTIWDGVEQSRACYVPTMTTKVKM